MCGFQGRREGGAGGAADPGARRLTWGPGRPAGHFVCVCVCVRVCVIDVSLRF